MMNNNYSKMNPFQAMGLAQLNFECAISELQPDYEVASTFASDFACADSFGADAVRDTYARAKEGWQHDYKMMTELVIVLNWAVWRYWELAEQDLYDAYYECWSDADAWCMDNLKGAELDFYLRTTD